VTKPITPPLLLPPPIEQLLLPAPLVIHLPVQPPPIDHLPVPPPPYDHLPVPPPKTPRELPLQRLLNATTAIQICPLKNAPKSSYLPCDAASLEMRHVPAQKSEGSLQGVSCSEPARRDATLSPHQKDLLKNDDLLLQVVAGFLRNPAVDRHGFPIETRIEKLQHARIVLEGSVEPDCPTQSHRTLTIYNFDDQDIIAPEYFPLNSPTKPIALLAQSTRGLCRGFLEGFWPFSSSRRTICHVAVDSCGVSDGSEPVVSLTGRIEVWPCDDVELVWKVPFGRKRKKSGEYYTDKSTGKKVEKERKEQSTGWPWARSETKTARHQMDGEDVIEDNEDDAGWYPGQDHPWNQIQLSEERSMPWNIKPDVRIRHNGVETDLTDALNKVLNFHDTLDGFFKSLLDATPRVGWSLEIETSVAAGEITGRWGTRPLAAATHARIWEIEQFFELEAKLTLFSSKGDIAFGLSIKIRGFFKTPFFEFVAQIFLTWNIRASVKFAVSIRGELKGRKIPAEADVTFKMGGRGVASIFALKFESEATLNGGWELEAAMVFSKEKPISFPAKAKFKDFYLLFKFDGPLLSEPYYKQWPKSKDLTDGTLYDGEII
jgi:hypothetical protein